MNNPNLNKNEIYAIDAGDIWGLPEKSVYLIYSPLGGHISLATKENVAVLEACALSGAGDESTIRTLTMFQAKGAVPVHYLPQNPDELYQIDILCNYTCNFKCVYCYSAAGRSQEETKFEYVKAVMDYLFLSGKKQTNPYIINFSGGGEPLLSFELIKNTVEYIHSVADGTDYRYNIGLVTNGSLITREMIDYFTERRVDMAVSFEILKDLQDNERGSYERVAANIDMMLEREYPFGIRTTFTPDSVGRMCEMIETVHTRFPKLRKVVFDVVLAPNLFETPESLREYYGTFIEQYYKAKSLAMAYDITLESIAVETLSMLRDRTCEGKIVLTPSGTISSCARVSSPKESRYGDYIYGQVEDGLLSFDNGALQTILGANNIYTQSQCARCFAKWNCGGGCRLFHDSFSTEFEDVRCEFVKKALRLELANVLSSRFEKQTGRVLEKHIKSIFDKC